jgi:aryl-alcohol dehydrogenase-like predicted oxidoreductase
LVIATKVHGRMHDGPNGAGLSRKAIMAEVDASLSRLGTDYIDLYQIHRWDPQTPIEETLEALHEVVKAGKARCIGASSMNAWQFSKAHYLARMAGLTPFVSMQNHYNLLNREEEREMLPLCADLGIGAHFHSDRSVDRHPHQHGLGSAKRSRTNRSRSERNHWTIPYGSAGAHGARQQPTERRI